MKHELRLLIIFIALVFSFFNDTATTETKDYDWNNGQCSYCGGTLIWDSTGSKEHYICKICGKEYTFDKVMSKK